ncbi:MAG: FeoB-associated Cys-rich membrane protein [Desulfobulbaceae bacterium]|nr:FeoB-associated Cys-rich membrane protein [Desulfobulbaceae bacterium]
MQEILVALSLIAASIYVVRLLFKAFRGQASTCGCACQGCPSGSNNAGHKVALPMYQPGDSREHP